MVATTTTDQPKTNGLRDLFRGGDLGVLAALVLIIAMMIIPLPTWLLDILMVFSISIGIVMLLISMFLQKALDLLSFPSIVLVVTLFRLALNISSTRLILSQGKAFDGQVIMAFADFVTGGNFVVGGVIFVIITLVNFIVITKGAERVAEVAARFTLDAMPGKQMSIDADLNAGLIDGDMAKKRREDLSKESSFFGAMDGANKFVRGDAIAGIVILIVEMLGGLAIGMMQQGMEMSEAGNLFFKLTIGDGLVSQVPALLMSIATGLVVTKSASADSLGADLIGQLGNQPRAFAFAALVLGLFGIVPGLPTAPFLVLAGLLGAVAFAIMRSKAKAEMAELGRALGTSGEDAAKEAMKKPESLLSTLALDPIALKTGRNLVPLIDPSQDGPLLERITLIRYHIGQELGFVIPGVRVMDDLSLPPNEYVVEIRGTKISNGVALVNYHYVPQSVQELSAKNITAEETVDPVTKLPGAWVVDDFLPQLQEAGITVMSPVDYIANHFTEVVKQHADEIMTRQNVQSLLELVKNTNAAIVRELVPDMLSLGQVHKVLQLLVKERISIRDLSTILERLADYAHVSRDTSLLAEYVRQALARQICSQYADKDDTLTVLTIDPRLEETMIGSLHHSEYGSFLAIDPSVGEKILGQLQEYMPYFKKINSPVVVLCSPRLRPHFKRFTERNYPNIVVLSYNEIVPQIKVQSIGILAVDEY
ncbi:flagellar biosynthesis protein FlhA [Candidatus Termititenax persephonae]|uniref:Flagellar biosynthesis protein FlhA n=1 Tax=Candidatus Termititenax persephonae TaxID=2218525 RepID=A0A388TE89_9BACT|nr:flagellar biosynthesis protein FlhA [Candidatus Termititenax persephonae]